MEMPVPSKLNKRGEHLARLPIKAKFIYLPGIGFRGNF